MPSDTLQLKKTFKGEIELDRPAFVKNAQK